MSHLKTTAGEPRQSPGAQPILLALGFALLIVISAASVWLVDRSNDDTEAVVHTLDVQNRHVADPAEPAPRRIRAARLRSDRSEVLPAANTASLPPTRLSRSKMPRTATADNPQQVERLTALTPLIRDKLEEMERVIGLYDQGRLPEAQEVIRAGEGRNLMENIRDHVLTMYNAERDLLDARRAESRRTSAFLLAATLVGSALILLIGALSIYLVQRNAREREQAQHALKAANENLEIDCRRTHCRSARSQRRNSTLRLYRQSRSAIAAGQHHGLHHRDRGYKKRHIRTVSRRCDIPIPPRPKRM